MILHQFIIVHLPNQPKDEQVAARRCDEQQAESQQQTIPIDDASDRWKQSQKDAWHCRADPVGIHLQWNSAMGVGCKRAGLKPKLDGAERLSAEDHPRKAMDEFVHDNAEKEHGDENKEVGEEVVEA